MSASDIFTFLLTAGIFYVIIRITYRLFYRRYLKDYDQEVNDFLKAKGYKEYNRYPSSSDDWKKAPFKKPPSFSISLGPTIKFMGMRLPASKKEYFVIEAFKESGSKKSTTFWLEIHTVLASEPKLTFRRSRR